MMCNSVIYGMNTIEQYNDRTSPITFVFAASHESRSKKGLEYLYNNRFPIEQAVLLNYEAIEMDESLKSKLLNVDVTQIEVKSNPIEFINDLKTINLSLWNNKVILDISCFRVPEMFSIMKYFKLGVHLSQLHAIYSIPYDYHFPKEPFTSYRSFIGDLTMYELLGFSGQNDDLPENSDLFLFIGFEGALALKVAEDTVYKELNLINNLPSFYPKYKDISVINNYHLMQSPNHLYYTPADNPFETYNLLNEIIGHNISACISPLSTKPVALGVCLYALDNEKIRVVYPVSQKYNSTNTLETYRTCFYDIVL